MMSNASPRGYQQFSHVAKEEKVPEAQTNGANGLHELQPELQDGIKYNNESESITPNPARSPDALPGLTDLSRTNDTNVRQAGPSTIVNTAHYGNPARQSHTYDVKGEEPVVNELWNPQFAGDRNDGPAPAPLDVDSFNYSTSSFSSVYESTCSGITRRDNPKSAFTRMERIGGQELEFVPWAAQYIAKENDPEPVSRLGDGTLLFRACESVPFILVTLSCLEAIRRSVQTEFPQRMLDNYDFADESALGLMDKALILILVLLLLSVESRNPTAELTLQGTQTQGHRLVVFKDVGPGVPEPICIDVGDFITLYKDWKQHPNPALCSNNRPDVKTPWSEVMQMLQDRNVSLDLIDASIHFKLTQTPAGEKLDNELEQVRLAAESGELLPMKNNIENHRRPDLPHHTTSFSYMTPATRDRNTVFSLRYTHETPQGKLEDRRGKVDGFFANDQSDVQRRKLKLKQGMQALKAKKDQWAKTSCGRRTKVVVSIVLVIVIVATLLVVLYFKVILEQGG